MTSSPLSILPNRVVPHIQLQFYQNLAICQAFSEKRRKLLQSAPFAAKIQAMERQFKDYQMRTLRFIHDYIKSNGCAPNRKEIGEALGISITSASSRIFYLFGHDCLRKPETWQYGRNIALTEKGIRACEGEE